MEKRWISCRALCKYRRALPVAIIASVVAINITAAFRSYILRPIWGAGLVCLSICGLVGIAGYVTLHARIAMLRNTIRRADYAICTECGYALQKTEGICPECGAKFSLSTLRQQWQRLLGNVSANANGGPTEQPPVS